MFRVVVSLVICWVLSSANWCRAQTPQTSESPSDAPSEAQSPPVAPRSYVYHISSSDAIADYDPNPSVVHRMVDDLVMAATNEPTVAAAWSSLVKPSDVVGIKVCANGAPLFGTHPAVVNAIVEGLAAAGVPSQNIVVWDREADLLKAAGFHIRNGGYRLMWTENNYDPKAVITSPISGKLIYGDLLFVARGPGLFDNGLKDSTPEPGKKRPRVLDNLSDQSHLSNVLTHVVTKVINVPVLSDNVYCGLSGALFNMTVQNMDNWRRLVEDPVNGDPTIPEAYADPRISDKVVFQLMDGLVALYAGGPMGDANYSVQYGTLYASKDPVALDAIALRRIDEWRASAQLEPASKTAKYVQTASTYGLGNADMSKIEVVNVR
ncbi:MAG TPA: DUF362 domain-containing protein [Chthoniobacterales bacterium]|nr:DUF362 domain-containing protein [Chthoniobacterales bacterium]